jgi:hypothetical protein
MNLEKPSDAGSNTGSEGFSIYESVRIIWYLVMVMRFDPSPLGYIWFLLVQD